MSEDTKNNNQILSAGIDIGSNSIRMLIAYVKNGTISELVDSMRETTRLAAGIAETGRLSATSLDKSIAVLKKFKEKIDLLNVKNVKAYATSAVREAANGNDFISAVKNIGIDIEIITGIKEANLIYAGVKAGMDIGASPIIFDTGGGSTEFLAARDNKVIFAESYKIGVVKLIDMFDMNSTETAVDSCKDYIAQYFSDIKLPEGNDKLIATAGTATTIAAIDLEMEHYDWRLINGHTVDKYIAERIFDMILQTPFDKRINIRGMENGRQDIIIPGIMIMLEIMKKTGFDKITVSDFGLREGAIVAAADC